MCKKTAALENVNLFLLNQKINEFIAKNKLTATENNCRLVQMTLRHKVHHFPTDIPFVAVVKKCTDGQQVVFNIKRTKTACIANIDVSSETTIGRSFVIDGIKYTLADTVNNFPRYKPQFNKIGRRNNRIELPEEDFPMLKSHREV